MNAQISSKIGDYILREKQTEEGLMYGNAGISIFFYNLAKATSSTKYKKYADLLIDNLFRKANPLMNFRNGLAGIGWCIEYLIQHDFCSGNADIILEDIDNKVYRALNEQKDMPYSLNNGYIGYLQYIMMRLRNKKSSMAVRMINIELFKQVINKIDFLTPLHFPNLIKDIRFDLLNDNYVLIGSLNNALSLNIYNGKIINMFSQWESYLTSYMPALHFNRLYLSILLFQMNQSLHLNTIDRHIKTLLFSVEKDTLMTEIDLRKINNIRYGFLGLQLVLKEGLGVLDSTYPNYQLLSEISSAISELCDKLLIEKIEHINNVDIDNRIAHLGIAEGWSGVGLLLLKTNILNCNI